MNADRLTAGVARADITPEDLRGLNPFGPSFDRVHDSIHLRVVVFGHGSTTAAIIAADLVEVGDTTDIRQRIEQQVGIPASRVLIAPSHDHNAPRIGLVPPGGKARIPTPESLAYTEVVYDAMVDTVQRAQQAARPARIGVGRGTVDVNVSREAYANGRWGLGINPDGLSDKSLRVVSVVSDSDEPMALFINYAVHSTVALGVPEVSGDLAGAAARFVERELGGDAVAIWLSGALGDQAPRVSLGRATGDAARDRTYAFDAMDAQGLLVGATALQVAGDIDRYNDQVAISGDLRVVPCPARRLEVPPGMEQADVDSVDLTLTWLRIGSVGFAGVSGEVTVPVHRALARVLPLSETLLVSNANARIGYLPTDESYDRQTQAAEGCPIVQGYAQKSIIDGLLDLMTADSQAIA